MVFIGRWSFTQVWLYFYGFIHFNYFRTTEMDYGTIDSKGSGAETSRPSTLPRPQRIFEVKKSVTLHIHLKAILQGITIGASLLPSLRAQHKVSQFILFCWIVKMSGSNTGHLHDICCKTYSNNSGWGDLISGEKNEIKVKI